MHDDGVVLNPPVGRHALVLGRLRVQGDDNLFPPRAHLLGAPVGLAGSDGDERLRALKQSLVLLDSFVDVSDVVEDDDIAQALVVTAQVEPALDNPWVLASGSPLSKLRLAHAGFPVDDKKLEAHLSQVVELSMEAFLVELVEVLAFPRVGAPA